MESKLYSMVECLANKYDFDADEAFEIVEKNGRMDDILNLTTSSVTPTNVLSICQIPESVNLEKLKKYIADYISPRESYYREKSRSLFIEDEFSEYFTAKATNGTEIGAGHCGMDVKTEENEGIDAMCVIMNKDKSNEKSLIQNFAESGADLDVLFKEKKDIEAVKLYAEQFSKKLEHVKRDKNLTDLFILAFVSTETDVYAVCFKLDLENIKYVSSGGFVNKQKEKCVNINVSNFIDPKHGNVNLYKSKKRMELRLYPSILENEHAVKLYTMS